jgi:ABC-type Zn2+ transport system substrate-binding protein/surface adhesin
VAEGQEPAEADQQVERAGEEREAHHLHQEHGVQHQRREREERDHQHEGDFLVFHFWVPNRPAGLISSTITMMMKITVFDASG